MDTNMDSFFSQRESKLNEMMLGGGKNKRTFSNVYREEEFFAELAHFKEIYTQKRITMGLSIGFTGYLWILACGICLYLIISGHEALEYKVAWAVGESFILVLLLAFIISFLKLIAKYNRRKAGTLNGLLFFLISSLVISLASPASLAFYSALIIFKKKGNVPFYRLTLVAAAFVFQLLIFAFLVGAYVYWRNFIKKRSEKFINIIEEVNGVHILVR